MECEATAVPHAADPAAVPAALLEWIGATTGRQPRECRRLPTVRPAWTLVLDGAEVESCVLRGARQQAFGLGSVYHLRREAAITDALWRETSLPVPRVIGLCPEPEALLMERLPGSQAFGAPDTPPAASARMLADFVDAIAQLHTTPLHRLARGEAAEYLQAPTDPAREELAIWRTLAAAAPDDALLALGFEDLARDPPPCPRAVLVQGDTGPNQCLFENGRLSALLDWELAHAGDPMEDLGWIAARAFYADYGSLDSLFSEYARCSNIVPVPQRIAWYQALALLKCAIATGSARRNAQPGDDLASIRCWDAITRAALVRCLQRRRAHPADPALDLLSREAEADLVSQQQTYGALARLHEPQLDLRRPEPKQ